VQTPTQEFLTLSEPMPESTQSRDQFKQNLAADVLRATGSLRLAASGYSMLPTLWPGDLLTIQALSFDQVQAGDVVLFAREGRFFIHRVLRKLEMGGHGRLVTRGDAMPDADAPVSEEELLGKVVSAQGHRDFQECVCSRPRRWTGLTLAYSTRLRSVVLRWHTWRSTGRGSKSKFASERTSQG
jgi:signal peptidase I